MRDAGGRLVRQLDLCIPVIVVIVAFTAIPLQFRAFDYDLLVGAFHRPLRPSDMVANIVGYIPVGVVLAGRGVASAIALAGSLTVCSEASQLFAVGRIPSATDVGMNLIGAVIGVAVRTLWKNARLRVTIGRVVATIAAVLALAYAALGPLVTPRTLEAAAARLVAAPPSPRNSRGLTTSGRLEGHWRFDDPASTVAADASGHGLSARLVHSPATVPGVVGQALRLNGVDQYADLGDVEALRLSGSMTLSAWFNATAFPSGNVAIVSGRRALGYQLDASPDQGTRVVSAKLADASGRLMARYGTTVLEPNTWYLATAVYDAHARSLDLYVNGVLDNGCMAGAVTARQRTSPGPVYIGRSGQSSVAPFAGAVDDVRIYSRALTRSEIEAMMAEGSGHTGLQVASGVPHRNRADVACRSSEIADGTMPGMLVGYGLLVAVACIGFWPTASYARAGLLFSLAAGVALIPAVVSLLPHGRSMMVPVLTFLGGAAVAVSVRSR
jgi:hypothetical protein